MTQLAEDTNLLQDRSHRLRQRLCLQSEQFHSDSFAAPSAFPHSAYGAIGDRVLEREIIELSCLPHGQLIVVKQVGQDVLGCFTATAEAALGVLHNPACHSVDRSRLCGFAWIDVARVDVASRTDRLLRLAGSLGFAGGPRRLALLLRQIKRELLLNGRAIINRFNTQRKYVNRIAIHRAEGLRRLHIDAHSGERSHHYA
mmetsp:Transcript_2065/g.3391  ORF Transcript_2065/g.3391 Transcript_2065/m.3391 type:complete len:200 (-) Transcript_2065:493-1092(-)